MKEAKIIYGGSESYRRMCRYQSGLFFRHELMKPYDYYWRIVSSSCILVQPILDSDASSLGTWDQVFLRY